MVAHQLTKLNVWVRSPVSNARHIKPDYMGMETNSD